MTKPGGLGKPESVFALWFQSGQVRIGSGAGQGVTIIEPAQEIAILAALGAERMMLRAARFAADRAGGAVKTG